MEEGCKVVEWRIENFGNWCAEVHGQCIESLHFLYCDNIQLYPKGISGIEERLVVRFCGVRHALSGDLSFHPSNGTMIPELPVNATGNEGILTLPPGPKFEDVLYRIRDDEDFLTVRCLVKHRRNIIEHISTTINVLKISLKINPRLIEKMKSDDTKEVFNIPLSPNNELERTHLKICSENETVLFTITPPTEYDGYPFAVEMYLILTESDDTVDRRVMREHVFSDTSPWTYPYSLEKKELLGKEVSLSLYLKTENFVEGPFYMNSAYSCVSIESNRKVCFPKEEPPTDPPVTSDKPDDSVLSNDLMCLYQDQDFSDITLKCDSVSFPVHKNILSARSPVFKTMLSTDMTEASSGTVEIGDLDPSTLGLFLTYLYTGEVEEELQCDRALKLYYAADKYQVPSLKGECANFLCSKVSLSHVCDILSLGDRHRDDKLISTAHDFILSNYNDVLKSKEWEGFMCREPLLAAKTLTHFAAKDSVRKHDPE